MPIRKVKEFEIGQIHEFEGVICCIERFPFRSSICLRAIDPKPDIGQWSSCKITIREFRESGRYYPSLKRNRRSNR